MLFVYLAVGGVIGTLLRYLIGTWVYSWAGTWLPWGTLAVNILGSFVLGFAMRTFEGITVSLEVRSFLTIGFCGAFTTFSSYTYETFALLREGDWTRAGLYVIGSVTLAFAALVAGFLAAVPFTR